MAGHGRYDAFISYRSVDVRVARELADQLIASGRRVWFAEYEILLSNFDEFQQSVLEGLRRSKRAIAITSDLYTQSQYCAVELATLMERVGPGRILEVRLPGEHESHRLFPELSHSPQCTSRDTAEILSFVAGDTGWSIAPVLRIDASAPSRRLEGICLDVPYSLDVSGWEVVDPRGYRHPDGTLEGPVLHYPGADYPIDVNVFAGPETAPEAQSRDPTQDDRKLYGALRDYLPRHLGRLDADLRGLHLLFHGGLSQLAVTYVLQGFWMRKHSVILPHPSGGTPAEFVFTFGFVGPFEEYCRHAAIMDGLVETLRWG